MALLELVNLNKTFKRGNKEMQILDHLSYAFKDKGLYIIVGKSGCGKSTLLKTIAGIDPPSGGEVRLNNLNIYSLKFNELLTLRQKDISIIFQNYCLIKSMTALDNLCLPTYISNEKRSIQYVTNKAKGLLRMYAGDIRPEVPCSLLSGGQQQRVAILRLAMIEPKVILADEPTGALDSGNSFKIMQLFKDISKNKLVIMVTHNLNLAFVYADTLLCLKEGKLYELSKMEDGILL